MATILLTWELGGGLGHLAYYAAWERIYHLCGGANWLGQFTISHWAFGPSPVLSQVTSEANKRIMPDMIAGKAMMCFGMSEPGAGSDAGRRRGPAEKTPGFSFRWAISF